MYFGNFRISRTDDAPLHRNATGKQVQSAVPPVDCCCHYPAMMISFSADHAFQHIATTRLP
jgi:hypothetical protein